MRRILGSLVVILLILVVLLGIAYAAVDYSVDSGNIDWNNDATYFYTDTPRLVRWPNGILHSVHNEQYSTTQEIYWDYSVDDGLNWTNTRLTAVGHDQRNPTIAQSSNWDLHVAFAGRGSGSYPNTYALKYMHYDYSESTWTGPTILHDANTGSTDDGDWNPRIMVDGDDNVIIVFGMKDESPTSSKIYYIENLRDGDSWDGWSSVEEVASSGASDCVMAFSAAIDQDNNVGVAYACMSNGNFYHREYTTDTWTNDAFHSLGGAILPALMASISSGDTVWRVVYGYGATVYYNQRASGSWGTPANTAMTWETQSAIAQEHGSGDGDTGDFWAISGDATALRYVEYQLGVGWQTPTNDLTKNAFSIGATKALFPYTESGDWHWNLPATHFGAIYIDDAGNGWADGDEIVHYYFAGTEWGIFPPIVETDTPTSITKSTATFNGELLADGGATITARGFQYGLTQTPTWSVSQSGSYSAGAYSLPVTGLTGLTSYYVRAYVDSSEGSSYGEWIGFATIDLNAVPNDFTAIPISSSQINLEWNWIPAPDSEVRLEIYYSEDSYPVTREAGTHLYSGFGNDTSATGLEAGTSYYFRGWPYDTDTETYSSTYVEDWATTFGGTGGLDDPDVPDEWFQDPLCTAYSAIPLLWDAIEATNTGFGFPLVTLCVLFTTLWISVLSVGVGGLLLKSGMWTMMIGAILILICAMATLLPLWMIAVSIVLGGLPIYNWRRT